VDVAAVAAFLARLGINGRVRNKRCKHVVKMMKIHVETRSLIVKCCWRAWDVFLKVTSEFKNFLISFN
jgi:hypothetical protein